MQQHKITSSKCIEWSLNLLSDAKSMKLRDFFYYTIFIFFTKAGVISHSNYNQLIFSSKENLLIIIQKYFYLFFYCCLTTKFSTLLIMPRLLVSIGETRVNERKFILKTPGFLMACRKIPSPVKKSVNFSSEVVERWNFPPQTPLIPHLPPEHNKTQATLHLVHFYLSNFVLMIKCD